MMTLQQIRDRVELDRDNDHRMEMARREGEMEIVKQQADSLIAKALDGFDTKVYEAIQRGESRVYVEIAPKQGPAWDWLAEQVCKRLRAFGYYCHIQRKSDRVQYSDDGPEVDVHSTMVYAYVDRNELGRVY